MQRAPQANKRATAHLLLELTCALQREASFGLAHIFLLDIVVRIHGQHLLTCQEQKTQSRQVRRHA